MSSQLGYDLCTYRKIDLKIGVFSVRSYALYVNGLLESLQREGIQRSSINMDNVISFFHNLTEEHNSYKNPYKKTLKEDGSVDSLRKLSEMFSLQRLDEDIKGTKYLSKLKDLPSHVNLNPLKLGIVYKYKFCDEVRCSDRTYLIVNLQRRFRKWSKNK